MGKLDVNKKAKEESLLSTAYRLFTQNGVSKTSVSDITKDAGVAKGTFYLYFKDKYDLKNRLVAHQSSVLFKNALADLEAKGGKLGWKEQIMFIIDNILDQLDRNRSLLIFVSKNLSWGVFKNALTSPAKGDDLDFVSIYNAMIKDAPADIRQPEIMIFMIIELISSTCYSAILYSEPVSLEELKPYLYRCVDQIIESHISSDTRSQTEE
ncbi:MAG: TetR/AcrR family transcriptional regulator [Ruminococcus sp.]|nr:TetR/AcrR family transcriptional regulator [Ruminococcus sp.]